MNNRTTASIKITNIGTAVPPHQVPQDRVVGFMSKMMDVPEDEHRKLRIIYKASGIQTRYSVINDYDKTENFVFFPNDASVPHPSTAARMHLYEQHAPQLAIQAIEDCLPSDFDVQSVTHLVTFSCTGMYAPGLDLDIAEHLELTEVSRTCINFMGCYAAFNALKVAYAFANAFENAKVLIVGVELCTLHFQRFNEYDHIIANSLFGDGAVAALIQKTDQAGLSIENFYHAIVRDGKQEMAWRIEDTGFHMQLSGYVPRILKENLSIAFDNLLAALGIGHSAIDYFAVHPGGRKILESVEAALQIQRPQVSASYEVLKNYGNMSSVTVLFVLKHLLEMGLQDGQNILGMAFGPGLTVEAATFTYED